MACVAIFDSGVGGLSIYQEVKNKLPDCSYLFVSDNQAFPYGTKAEDELKQRVLLVVSRIVAQFNPDILIIACNTASTVVLPLLRERFDLPIVGVVPAIKPAAELSITKTIGLLATPATIQRDYTDQLIQEFASDCDVIRVGSSKLVQIAEDKLSGRTISLGEIEQQLRPFIESEKIDVIILACTHFPLLNKEIEAVLQVKNQNIKLIDSGVGIANRVAKLVSTLSTTTHSNQSSSAVFTDVTVVNTLFNQQLYKLGFSRTIQLN